VEQAAKARLSSVANSIRLLTSFSGEENELGITTLATRLRLAKSTVHRLASTLTSAGFLEQNAQTGKYRLGVALFELGALVRRRMDVANEARPKLRELLDRTGETLTRREDLVRMLEGVRQRGHAVDDEESESGLRAIAAPVRNHAGTVIAALGVAAPVQRMSKKALHACIPTVIDTASAVSARLGYVRRNGD
jgi:DNA-binding IclR family transcriptional regulator